MTQEASRQFFLILPLAPFTASMLISHVIHVHDAQTSDASSDNHQIVFPENGHMYAHLYNADQ